MKNILFLLIALFMVSEATAQVKFNLSYAESTGTYTVSIVPEVSWSAPLNMVASAQVVLRIDADKELIPAISSSIPGLTWADNAYVEHPEGATEYNFVCISLVNGPTAQISFSAGEEISLFSFVNSGSTCAGMVALLPNDDPMVEAVRNAGFNITQHLAVLGARGNAFSGFVNSEADCSASSGVFESENKTFEDVKISPVPSDKSVKIQWTQVTDKPGLRQMTISDAWGKEVFRESIPDGKGQHVMVIDVEHWPAGLYRARFILENHLYTQPWNLMVVH